MKACKLNEVLQVLKENESTLTCHKAISREQVRLLYRNIPGWTISFQMGEREEECTTFQGFQVTLSNFNEIGVRRIK